MGLEQNEDFTLRGREATSYYVDDGLTVVWYEETETEPGILDILWEADGPYADLDDASPEEFEERVREILAELFGGEEGDLDFELIGYEEIGEEEEEEIDEEDDGFNGCKLPG
jgi:hypothetical protein